MRSGEGTAHLKPRTICPLDMQPRCTWARMFATLVCATIMCDGTVRGGTAQQELHDLRQELARAKAATSAAVREMELSQVSSTKSIREMVQKHQTELQAVQREFADEFERLAAEHRHAQQEINWLAAENRKIRWRADLFSQRLDDTDRWRQIWSAQADRMSAAAATDIAPWSVHVVIEAYSEGQTPTGPATEGVRRCSGAGLAQCLPQCNASSHGKVLLATVDGSDSSFQCSMSNRQLSWTGSGSGRVGAGGYLGHSAEALVTAIQEAVPGTYLVALLDADSIRVEAPAQIFARQDVHIIGHQTWDASQRGVSREPSAASAAPLGTPREELSMFEMNSRATMWSGNFILQDQSKLSLGSLNVTTHDTGSAGPEFQVGAGAQLQMHDVYILADHGGAALKVAAGGIIIATAGLVSAVCLLTSTRAGFYRLTAAFRAGETVK